MLYARVKGSGKIFLRAWSRAGAPGQRARGEIVASRRAGVVPAGWPGSGAGGQWLGVPACRVPAWQRVPVLQAGGRADQDGRGRGCRVWRGRAGVRLGACCVGWRVCRVRYPARVGVWACGSFWVRLVMRGIPCGVMGWLVWSWLFGVVWFTLATKLAMQKHPISVLYLCWLANPFAGRNRLSGAGHWTLGFPSFPRRPLI